MTNYIIGERCSGKTTRLIGRSAKEGIYILAPTRAMAGCIAKQAKEMGLEIPYPVTIQEYLRGSKFHGSSIRRDGLLIDDLDLMLYQLFGDIPIHEVTLTDHGNVERLESLLRKEKKKMDLQEMSKLEQMNQYDSKGTVTLPLGKYDQWKEETRKYRMELELAYAKVERLEKLLERIGMPIDTLYLITPEQIEVYQDRDISNDVDRYRIDIRMSIDR